MFFKRQADWQNGEYETKKKNRGQIKETFRPGASSVVETGENVSFICPLFFFLVSYSPFCQSAKNIMDLP